MGDWDIVTLSSGWAVWGWVEKSTTSVSIRWIRLNYMYLDESSLSLSVLFASHNMVGWHIFVGMWNNMYLYDKPIYTLAYPFSCLIALCVVLLLLRWSSIYWCEQMRGTPVVNKEVMVPLLSLWTGFCFWVFFRAMAYVLLVFGLKF